MKTMMFFILLSVTTSAPRLKLKHLDKTVPLYLHIHSLLPNIDDEITLFLRDTLGKSKMKLISRAEKSALMKQFFEDAKGNIADVFRSSKNKDISTEEIFRKMYSSGTPNQEMTIFYRSLTVKDASLLNCDSVGFLLLKMPELMITGKVKRLVWSINDIGSRSADTVALYLLARM